ncbi:MAG TPA: MnhB domain-containing protein [Candidatus Hydrogenedentes bacterium]|nr:MnhB domain-containing protein [Candidatus Hydrogenedentota bacterium]
MSKEREQGMSLIVKTITRLTVGLILLYGIYIVTHGHVSPGGGFAGGVIIALAFVHLLLAFGKDTAFKVLSESMMSILESTGALLFLLIALIGFVGGHFFMNVLPKGHPFNLFSAGIILPCNIAICLKVGAGLFAIAVALVLLKLAVEKEEK